MGRIIPDSICGKRNPAPVTPFATALRLPLPHRHWPDSRENAMNRTRRTLLALSPALLLAASLAAAGCAEANLPVVPFVNGNVATLQVVDRATGGALSVYSKGGERFIVGNPGNEYALRLSNRTGARILVVASVDGVNIVSGETATPEQSGYVLGPWESVDIEGWRKSMDQTAAFFFTDLANSYAARTGRPQNVGVIGLAVFQERQRLAMYPRQGIATDSARASNAPAEAPRLDAAESRAAQKPAPDTYNAMAKAAAPEAMAADGAERDEAAAAQRSAGGADSNTVARMRADRPVPAAPAPSLGTGHGRIEDSSVRRVDFVRATSSPAEVLAVRYDRRDNLVAMGVIPAPTVVGRAPEPFPGMRFVPDPR
jgi:hypothetical protein